MRPMHTLALVLSLAAAVPAAHADDATRRAKAEQMLQITKTDAAMQQQLAALEERVHTLASQQSGGPNQTPAQQKLTEEYVKQVQSATSDEVSWEKLRPLLIQNYAESFTEPELDAILVFYKSPAGQAIVAKTPELSAKTMNMVQDRIKELQPKLAQLTQDYSTKMKAAEPAAKPSLNTLPPK